MRTNGKDTARDPICGEWVDPERAERVVHKKRTYFFCSARCKERFERQAERHRMSDLARVGSLLTDQKVHWGLA